MTGAVWVKRGGQLVQGATLAGGSADATILTTQNLNDIQTSGTYVQEYGPNATTARNYPIPYAGLLEVTRAKSGNFIWQRYTAWAALTEQQWIRGFYQGAPYSWRRAEADPPAITFGSWSGVFASRYNVASGMIERRGVDVELSGAITAKAAISIPQSGSYDVGNISPVPLYNKHVLVSTQSGSLELLIMAGSGLVSLRNWSGVTRNIAAGGFIGLGGIRYRTAP